VTDSQRQLAVYLAGGHRSDWRERVMSVAADYVYRNPAEHKIDDARAYTAWDLEAIRRSDVVFGYLEQTNPSGYGLALEVGYAKGIGRHVILVDERSKTDEKIARYYGIVRETADAVFDSLDEGIAYLLTLYQLA
jgi:nucleoside 2-deoxyribosyltransferase